MSDNAPWWVYVNGVPQEGPYEKAEAERVAVEHYAGLNPEVRVMSSDEWAKVRREFDAR